MAVSFNQIPGSGWKLPLVWIETDPSQAGTPTQALSAMLVGYKLTAGSAEPSVPVATGSPAQARALFGAGSMLERMFSRFFALNKAQVVYCLPIDPPSTGVAATGSLTVTTAPSAAGTLSLYVAGQLVTVGVGASDTAAQVATNIVAAIDAVDTLPVTAAVDGTTPAKVNLTCKWKGLAGNEILILHNYRGVKGGEQLPAGLALTYANGGLLTGGTGNPDFAAAIANLGDEPYEYVGMPFADTGSLSLWETEYGFGDAGRWGWLRALYGHVFSARRGTYANHLTFGAENNSGVMSIMAFEPTSPSPSWEWTAAYVAQASRALSTDPARPLHTLTLDGILPAPRQDRFSRTEASAIANAGLAVQMAVNGLPTIMREQTTHQRNSLGQPDNAYELVTTTATLAALFRRLQHRITSKYPRHKLANDGTSYGAGQAIVTANVIKAELVAEYIDAMDIGLVENLSAFKNSLIVERDGTDPNRVNVLYGPDIVNQLRMFAVLAQFRLQNSTVDQNVA